MAITMYEKFGSRPGTETTGPGSRQTLRYVLFGTNNDLAIKAHIQNNAPPTYDGLIAENYSIEQIGPDLWEADVNYVDPARKQETPVSAGEYTIDFDTTGGMTRITHAPVVASYAPPGEQAPDFHGAIGVRDGAVEGVDIYEPSVKRTVRKRMPRVTLSDDYIEAMENLAGKTNDAPFLNRAIGEVLFLGPNGSKGTAIDPEITLDFTISKNVTGLQIGDITNITKAGHDYLWVYYEEFKDPTTDLRVKRPRAVYVHRVYPLDDFSILNI